MNKNQLQRKSGIFLKIGSWIDDSIVEVSNILITLCVGWWGLTGLKTEVFNSTSMLDVVIKMFTYHFASSFIFTVSVACVFYFSWKNNSDSRKIIRDNKYLEYDRDKLRDQVNALEQEIVEKKARLRESKGKSVNYLLHLWSNEIELNNQDRVSLYYNYKNTFFILGRRALNPAFQDIHKIKFPLDNGVISEAWKKGVFVVDIPYLHKDSSDEYVNFCKTTFGYSKATIESLTMKSSSYYGVAINHHFDGNQGVVIFESLTLNRFNEQMQEKINEFLAKITNLLLQLIEETKTLDFEYNALDSYSSTRSDELEVMKKGGLR